MTEESGVYNNESVRDGRRFYACMYTINLKFQVIIGRGLLNNGTDIMKCSVSGGPKMNLLKLQVLFYIYICLFRKQCHEHKSHFIFVLLSVMSK